MASSSSTYSQAILGVIQKYPFRSAALSVTALSWADMKLARWRANQSDTAGTTHLVRLHETPRHDWRTKTAETSGLTYATLPGVTWGHAAPVVCSILPRRLCQWLGFEDPYWNESASYRVSEEGMWRIEKASFELHSLILEGVDEVIQSDDLLKSFGIPRELWPAIRTSWKNRESDLLGRFDFLWDGEGEPMLAEYNADTPTVLIESAATQRDWLKEKKPECGQFSVLDEAIKDGWRKIAKEQIQCGILDSTPTITVATQGASFWNDPAVFGAAAETGWLKWLAWAVDSFGSEYAFQEEATTGKYLQKLATEATSNLSPACKPKHIDFDTLMPEDLELPHQGALWKLYPWEWLIYEDIGAHMRYNAAAGDTFSLYRRVLEPTWKLVASSKAMLAYLYRKHPNHPNLLPAALADELVAVVNPMIREGFQGTAAEQWVAKPALGREGTGLSYGEDSGMKTLEEFVDLANQAGQVLAIPKAPPPPPAALSSLSHESKDSASLKRAVVRGLQAAPIILRLHHGPIDTKPEQHVGVHLGPPVVQQYYNVASLHGRKVIASAWVVRGMPVAACFREDNAKTTNNNSCFVPHFVEPAKMTDATNGKPQETCICPPRPFCLTKNQHRIRTELYGEGPVHSGGYGNEQQGHVMEEHENHPIAPTGPHISSCYGARGYAGRGESSTGGGSNNTTGGGGHSWFWFSRARTREKKKSAEVFRQERARNNAKHVSSENKVATSRARTTARSAATRTTATGGHGHATARGGRGYGG